MIEAGEWAMQNFKMVVFGFIGAAVFYFFQIQFLTPVLAGDKSIVASEFKLVDGKGNVRGQFGFSKEGPPGFWLMDEKGTARLAMGLYPDGTAHFGIQDKNGLMVQLARTFGAEESPLLIFKHRGNDSMIIGLNPTDQTPFVMHYEKNRTRKLEFGKYEGP